MGSLVSPDYYPFFGSLFVMLFIFGTIHFIIQTSTRKTKVKMREFHELERVANYAENIPLPEELIFYIDVPKLNIDSFTFSTLQEEVLKQAEFHISELKRFNGMPIVFQDDSMTNLNIKQQFGPVTLQTYIKYEQTYTAYTRRLLEFATFLIDNSLLDYAQVILLETVTLRNESSSAYIKLCDIYLETKNKTALNDLKEIVNSKNIFKNNTYAKNKVSEKINSCLNSLN